MHFCAGCALPSTPTKNKKPTTPAPVPTNPIHIQKPHTSMQAADHTALMHMQDILTYTVFSGHHAFISMLIKTMTNNIAQEYAAFPAVAEKFQTLERVLSNPEFGYHAKVVVFFFFLSIDYKVPTPVFFACVGCFLCTCLTWQRADAPLDPAVAAGRQVPGRAGGHAAAKH
jgi:hypothetical protein